MPLRLERRPEPSRTMVMLSPVIAVAATIVTGFFLFLILGHEPLSALHAFFIAPLNSLYGLAELGVKATPLILIGLGLAMGFRAGVWNIGAEGQLTLGAIAGGGMALAFYGDGGAHVLPLMILAAILGGMLWAAIPALLKTTLDVNEILTSLMLTYVGTLLLSMLVYGPWRDPEGYNFPESRLFEASATLPIILEGTRLHAGALVALLAVLVFWLVLGRTILGFQVRVIGLAPAAARFAGFSTKRMVWIGFLVGGGLAGLAGMFEVSGPIGQLVPSISPGYGFTAIIVAFLGRLHPIGVALAGLLVALSYLGGENAQIVVGLPEAVTGVFQGLLLFFLLAADVLVTFRLRYQLATEESAAL